MNSLIKMCGFAYRNWIFAKRTVFAFAEIIFWPLVSLLSIGLMSRFLHFRGNIVNFVLTGTITSGILQITQLDISYSVLYDVWSKSFKHTFLCPVSHFHYVFGAWVVGMTRALIVLSLLTFFGRSLFRFALPPFPVTVIFIAGVFLNALIVGMTVCILVILFGQRVEVTAWSMVALLMLVCGIYYPVSYLPPAVKIISQLIPLTYFLEYFRTAYEFEPLFTHGLLKGFIGVALYILLGLHLLNRAFKRSLHTGMILRLSE